MFSQRPDISKQINICTIIGIYCFSLVIIFLHPLEPLPWQWADDNLYFKTAQSIINNFGSTPWAGHFQNLNLSKAPFFPVFLVIINFLGIPLRFAEFGVFAPLPFLFWLAVRPLQLSNWFIIISASICLIILPIAGIESRLLRDTLFGGLAIYCLIFLYGYITRVCLNKKNYWIWSLGAGFSVGFAIVTREEASWLMIPAILAIILPVIFNWRNIKFHSIFFAFLLMITGFLIPKSTFSYLNFHSYGMYAPSIRQSSEFKNLYSTLCSLEPSTRQQYVPINTKTRLATYKISPHFAQLSPFLEGKAMDNLATNKGHLALNGFPSSSREFFVSNFEFALTASIMYAGYTTGPNFLNFCNKTVQEITIAIKNGKINAGQKGISLLPPLEIKDTFTILSSSLKSLKFLINGQGVKRSRLTADLPSDKDYAEHYYWHTFLRTWPYPFPQDISPSSIKEKNIIFNFVVNIDKFLYPTFLLFGLIAFLAACFSKSPPHKPIFTTLFMAWSSLLGFSLTMGLVNTIAFPILQGPGSYNKMGFYPLHFLLLTSIICVYFSFKQFFANKVTH